MAGNESPGQPGNNARGGANRQGRDRGGGGDGGSDRTGGVDFDQLVGGDGSRSGRGGSGPITTEGFTEWSDRLREVEEMIDIPDLRNDVATARDRARRTRQELRRDLKKPDWAVVRLEILGPLAEVGRQLDDELARRTTNNRCFPSTATPFPTGTRNWCGGTTRNWDGTADFTMPDILAFMQLTFAGWSWLIPALAIAVVATTILAWSYRSRGRLGIRVACLVLKWLGIAALAACLLEPLRTGQRARPGANLFAVVADNSQGLQIKDAQQSLNRGERLKQWLEPVPGGWQNQLAESFRSPALSLRRPSPRRVRFCRTEFQRSLLVDSHLAPHPGGAHEGTAARRRVALHRWQRHRPARAPALT